jgi:hypothetical protein
MAGRRQPHFRIVRRIRIIADPRSNRYHDVVHGLSM